MGKISTVNEKFLKKQPLYIFFHFKLTMVNKVFLHPQEIETYYIIPTIRKYLAIFMQEQKLKQKDIANILGINSATISQYKSEKRAHKIHFDERIIQEIKTSAIIIKDRFSYLRETQRLLNLIREREFTCAFHKLYAEVPHDCNPKEVGCAAGLRL